MPNPHYSVGRYACKVTGQALGQAKTGNPQFVLRFKVLGQVDPANPANYIPNEPQYERTHYRVITEKTIDYFIEDLKTLGFHGTSFKELDPSHPGHHSFVGMDIDMWCKHGMTLDGTPREEWSVAMVSGRPEFKIEPLDAKKARELDNLFGKHLKSLAGNSEQPKPVAVPAQAKPAVALGVTDEDIPFMRYDVPCL